MKRIKWLFNRILQVVSARFAFITIAILTASGCVPATDVQSPTAPPRASLITIDDYVRATEQATTREEFLRLNRAWRDACFARQRSYPLSQMADLTRACLNQIEKINQVAYRKGLAQPKRELTAEERRKADEFRRKTDRALAPIVQNSSRPSACNKPGTNAHVIVVSNGLC